MNAEYNEYTGKNYDSTEKKRVRERILVDILENTPERDGVLLLPSAQAFDAMSLAKKGLAYEHQIWAERHKDIIAGWEKDPRFAHVNNLRFHADVFDVIQDTCPRSAFLDLMAMPTEKYIHNVANAMAYMATNHASGIIAIEYCTPQGHVVDWLRSYTHKHDMVTACHSVATKIFDCARSYLASGVALAFKDFTLLWQDTYVNPHPSRRMFAACYRYGKPR